MALQIISAAEVRKLLPVGDCIDVMAMAMTAVSARTVHMPQRLIAAIPDGHGYFALMPGSSKDIAVYGAKVVSLHPGNPARGIPAVQGFVTLFDFETGAPFAIMDGAEVTAIRTAAASGLATRLLARPGARSHGILGAGVQALSHLQAIKAACPSVTEVLVWGRSPEKARNFVARHQGEMGMALRAVPVAGDAVSCDIVSVVTGAASPVVEGAWLKPGSHLNLVGAHTAATREVDTATIIRGRLYVDSAESALKEAGDILIPISEGAIKADHIVGEIGAVISGSTEGRTGGDQITLYKSLGLVAQDLFAARVVYDRALKSGMGTLVEF